MILNSTSIIESTDIVSVIGKFVDLKRSGPNYTAHSPFNPDDKTPSFVVSPRKGIFKCFSTGKGGDAVAFLMEFKGLTFVEAVEYLAEQSHHIIEYSNGANREIEIAKEKENKEIRAQLYAVMQKGHDSYNAVTVPENESSITIAGKSYTQATLEKWSIKTAGDWNHLTNISRSWTESERSALINLGVIKAKASGDGFKDFFHHRLLFPLLDDRGRHVGYNARVMEGYPETKEKPPKYLNSAESLIFNKSKFLFGYHQNEREISRLNIALLVEGPTDVIMLDQAGISYAVCSSGTGFTADQARILAKSADTVIICFDSDKAGHDATIRAITTLLRAQLEVKVKALPEGSDPASFVTESGADAFLDIPSIDAIEFAINANFPNLKDATPTVQSGALLLASTLISEISDENVREAYCQTLYKSLNVTRKVLSDLVKEKVEQKQELFNKLTPEQEQQKNAWGLYIDRNKYHDWDGKELSNFIVRPLFLIHYRGQANRVFEIINKFGASKILNVESNAFTKLSSFREETERGNFIWKGNEAQYTKVREWIYNEMQDVKAIEVLGYQLSTGIYAWANGITVPGSDAVLEVDEYGLVEYKTDKETTTYYLPALSKVNLSTDEDTDNELETHFVWNAPPAGSRAPRDLKSWADAFATLFGDNAAIGLAWTFATVYRDILHKRYDMFPHLNLFGPKGSGKTFMGDVIAGIFGKPMRPIHLVSSSPVAFYRRIAQTRNAIVRYEEYSEKVSPDKQEALKNFADGFGRVTGQMTNNNKTKSTPVLNSCIITGQVLPTQEPALLQRLISLYFGAYQGTKKSQQFGEQFKEWGKLGYFAFVTVELHKYRTYVEDRFADKMEFVRDHLRTVFAKRQPEDRVLNNFSMIASIYLLLAEKVKLPFSDAQMFDAIASRIEEQSRVVEGADELSGFWKVIEYLINQEKEKQGMGLSSDYYAVEYHRSLTVKVSETDTKLVEIDRVREYDGTQRDAKIMFIRMNYAHSLYSTKGEKMVSRIVDKNTLLHYMSQHKSYIGEIKAKRINDKPQRVYAFNLEHLPAFEFEPTNYLTKDKESTNTFVSPDYDQNSGMNPPIIPTDGEIPF